MFTGFQTLFWFVGNRFLGNSFKIQDKCNLGDSDGGDIVMLVTDLRCWWHNQYVGDFFRYVGDFLNVLNRSPTHLVSNIRHQHRCYRYLSWISGPIGFQIFVSSWHKISVNQLYYGQNWIFEICNFGPWFLRQVETEIKLSDGCKRPRNLKNVGSVFQVCPTIVFIDRFCPFLWLFIVDKWLSLIIYQL